MTRIIQAKPGRTFMGKLGKGVDLLDALTAVCSREQVRCGKIEAVGAVQKARIGFYDQQRREYGFLVLEEPLEITVLVGNISLKDGTPMVHAHVTLADETGKAYGGHLVQGTIVFACEFILQAFDEPLLDRGFDEATGLPLWTMAD
ncbi:MAG TPA: DNA-binding protein [Syntrophobacteraceae bacterium]|nr:DNA-binding protein [Syntrophobacteraceae bacterium]